MDKKKKIAIIGTNGIPANYGGFETLAENLVRELGTKYKFTVYCSRKNSRLRNDDSEYNAKLVRVPLGANGSQAIIYDMVTTFHAFFTADILLILGPAAGFILFFNLLFKRKIVVNHGGLDEWNREKYSPIQRIIIRYNHYIAAKLSHVNVADNIELKKSIKANFNQISKVIRYGGDHINQSKISDIERSKYPFLSKDYDLSISRAQIDNNLHLILETYSRVKNRNIVLISNWDISKYGQLLKKQYDGKYPNIFLVDAIYDKQLLNIIRSNTKLYIHSHSRCGTAPSLVEAMNYMIPIVCFDIATNRETTQNESLYFSSSEDLELILKSMSNKILISNKQKMYAIAKKEYKWKYVAKEYSTLF